MRLPCRDELDIKAGINALGRHELTRKHIQAALKYKTQAVFSPSANSQLSIELPEKDSSSSKLVSTEDQLLKAEIIGCMDIVNTNTPFSVVNDDNAKYQLMFPDSEIAKSYAQKADKIKYMMQFGIALVIRDIILDDLKGKPFSFLFDETTTSQIKKQYEGYATFSLIISIK